MIKRNAIKISLSVAVLAAAIVFTGCPREPKKTHNSKPDNQTEETIPIPTISFNRSNAEALAATLSSSQDRAARDIEGEIKTSKPLLQKILEDGTVQSALGIEGGADDAEWYGIDYVILPPENINSSDIYLLMEDFSKTQVTVEDSEGKKTNKQWVLSSLICIHEDNTYDDVLLESPYDEKTYFRIDSKDNIQFLKDGSVVYLYRGEGYNHFLNKWDPATKKTTQLYEIDLPVTEGSLFVRSFSINKDEDYIYMYLDRVEVDGTNYHYLKIIKISDSKSDLRFDKEIGNGFPGVTGWCYNPDDDCLYYSMDGLIKADKKGENPVSIGTDGYSHLIPQSEHAVWGQAGYDDNVYKIWNVLSAKTAEGLPSEVISYTAQDLYYFDDDYIFANNTLYLRHTNYDATGGHKDALIAIPLNNSNSEPKNLLDFNPNIQLHSWDVNEKFLFISGSDYETKEPVNCKIDLKTGARTTIQSDATFGAIAAL